MPCGRGRRWNAEVVPFELPPHLDLLLGDVAAGSSTPLMVGQVNAWRAAAPEAGMGAAQSLAHARRLPSPRGPDDGRELRIARGGGERDGRSCAPVGSAGRRQHGGGDVSTRLVDAGVDVAGYVRRGPCSLLYERARDWDGTVPRDARSL